MEIKTKIWVLFSVDNQYDQPDNNLVAWWNNKPNFEDFVKFFDPNFKSKTDLIEIIRDANGLLGKLQQIWDGETVRIQNTDYRLVQISEGKV